MALTGQFQKCPPDLCTEGKSPLDAIYQGCVIRFRPIMMTTMAALLGALPIAAGMGAGGLLFSQLVTLYLTPVYYTYLEALLGPLRRLTHGPHRPVPHALPARPTVATSARRG